LANRLQYETSPYLIQHAENPVDWYPWGEEAFRKAREEDKPVFLSVGYSTCHWCHVMAHESFEDAGIAHILNRHFVSIKVDKEERPDVDSIYMAFCQAFTGSGGWPTSIFMTAEQKPFFAGTYFPKLSRGRMIGFKELLEAIHEEWESNRSFLLQQADEILAQLKQDQATQDAPRDRLIDSAAAVYKRSYDRKNGGFGRAPKFPTPHNLLFLMALYGRRGDVASLAMAEHTLMQMYRGGLFDHMGFGFCRYSTDEYYLAPHFEKMLYDNALLMLAYCKAYAVTKKHLYLEIAEKTAAYVLREMTSPEGGFYSAQDADSEGEEGKYYLLTPEDVEHVLGEKDSAAFCRHFDITRAGNFEGKSIPNLLGSDPADKSFEPFLEQICRYRRERFRLHLDDKILSSWNALMIAAMCSLYRVSGKAEYLEAAKRADHFIRENLCEGDALFVSFRNGRRGVRGFLDDYAAYLFAQLALYAATLESEYLNRALRMVGRINRDFRDESNGGYYLYGEEHEALVLRPKESYDGAIPSGNGLMAWNLMRLSQLTEDEQLQRDAERQLDFLAREAVRYPTGHAMFLLALLDSQEPPSKITVVPGEKADTAELARLLPLEAVVCLLDAPTKAYPLKDEKTTFYICRNNSCLPPTNDLPGA